jgi:integrase
LAKTPAWLRRPVSLTGGMNTTGYPPYFRRQPVLLTGATSDSYTKQVSETLSKIVRVLGNQHVSSLTRENAVSFFEIIQKLPRDINKSPLYRDASIEQILKMEIKSLAPKTIKDFMSIIRVFSTWLKTSKHSTDDLFDGLVIRNIGKRNRFSPPTDITRFSTDDLQKIFTTKVFTDHKFLHQYYFWLPLIALYSGMRMNEISQLCPEDIYEIDGILMMEVKQDCDESEGKKLMQTINTESSRRKVPVHPKLIELGFLDYLATRKPGVSIFDGLKEYDGRLSHYASKWFNDRYLVKIGVKTKEKVFHSFRHTAIDELKQLDANIFKIKAIVGHSRKLIVKVVEDHDITFDTYGEE